MGTFLATNLWMNIQIPRESIQKKGLDEDGLISFLKAGIDFQPDIYDREDTEEKVVFRLKESILVKELLPFLQDYYAVYYHDPEENPSVDLLDNLKSLPPEKWTAYIEKDDSYTICHEEDRFLLGEYRNSLPASVQYWRLTLEGKVMAEAMNAHLHLFSYALKRAFADFSIVQALDVRLLG